MRSCAWTVLDRGGAVVSSSEATSQVGVPIRTSSARGEKIRVDGGHLQAHVAAVAASGDVDPVPVDGVASTLAYARGLLFRNRHARFCGSCGSATRSAQAGHVRVCTGMTCGRELFPRIEPAVIALVTGPGPHPRCLLARHHGAGPGNFSLLAGFVEIGESLEGTVRREVAEEAGVTVDTETYRGSQGWPFPAGLMVGFHATAVDDTIAVDGSELLEARWFTRDEVLGRIAGEPGAGPVDSIGGHLLRAWAGVADPVAGARVGGRVGE